MSSEPQDANRRLRRAGEIDRRSVMPLLGAGAAYLTLAGKAEAQQIPIPTTAAEVPGPASGTAMTTPYVQSVGRTAYFWGWALVNTANRGIAFSKVPEPGLLGEVGRAAEPAACSLPQMAGGSASALSLSRPARASLTLRPVGSLSRLKRPLSRGSSPASCPAKPLISYRIN
jgi:hypothetical protein